MNPYTNILSVKEGDHRWSFVYLHGKAEDAMAYEYQVQGVDEAPDIFAADAPKPEKAGTYIVDLFGRPAVALIGNHGGSLVGYVALIGDMDGMRQIYNLANGWDKDDV